MKSIRQTKTVATAPAPVEVLKLSQRAGHMDFFHEVWNNASQLPRTSIYRLAKLEAANENIIGLVEILVTDLQHRKTAESCSNVQYAPLGRSTVEQLLNASVKLLEESSYSFEELREMFTPAETQP